MPKRLKKISIEDNVTFDWSVHAINSCFGRNYKRWFKAVYNVAEGEIAWFPKLAVINGSVATAQDKIYGCINTISEDGKTIRERNSYACGRPENRIRHVFAKSSVKEPYKYVGDFKMDLAACTPDEAVYTRVGTSIDLTEWYSDTEWDLPEE